MIRESLVLLFVAACASAAVAQTSTTLYKSTGPDGKTVYSDRPNTRSKESRALTFQNAPASPLSAETLAYIAQLQKSANNSIAAAAAMAPNEVVLFSAAWCGYCKKAKAYLRARQVAFREVDIDTKEGLSEFARSGAKSGIPLLLAKGQRVSGFSAASYDGLFAARK